MDFLIESSLEEGLKECYPGDNSFWEPAEDPMKAIQSIGTVEEVLMNMASSEEDVYYAFLKQELAGKNYFNITEKEEGILNFRIAMKMLHENMDYQNILRCMTYAPMFSKCGKDTKARWDRAVTTTAIAINPVLSFTGIIEAKPLAFIDIYTAPAEEIYSSCLKAVLYKMPNLTIKSADEEIVKLLLNAGCKEDSHQFRGIIEKSLNFTIDYSNDPAERHNEWVDMNAKLEAFLEQAIIKAKSQMGPFKVKQMSDQDIYAEMQQKIRSMKELHEKGDGFEYWNTTIEIIKNTMARLQDFNSLTRTLNIWAVGLERASRELSLDVQPEHQEVQSQIKWLLESAAAMKKEEEKWAAFWPLCAKVELYSKELIDKLNEVQQKNPLLKLPEVQHAEPLSEVIGKSAVSSDRLYFAALKETVTENSGITQDEADNMIISKLLKAGRDDDDIMMAISNSPSFKYLNRTQAMGAATKMVDVITGKSTAKDISNVQEGRGR